MYMLNTRVSAFFRGNDADTAITIVNTEQPKSGRRQIDVGKDAAMEAEVRAARERATIPLDLRMRQFRDMLAEKQVSAFSTWEKELHKIVFDARYLLLTSKERKQVLMGGLINVFAL